VPLNGHNAMSAAYALWVRRHNQNRIFKDADPKYDDDFSADLFALTERHFLSRFTIDLIVEHDVEHVGTNIIRRGCNMYVNEGDASDHFIDKIHAGVCLALYSTHRAFPVGPRIVENHLEFIRSHLPALAKITVLRPNSKSNFYHVSLSANGLNAHSDFCLIVRDGVLYCPSIARFTTDYSTVVIPTTLKRIRYIQRHASYSCGPLVTAAQNEINLTNESIRWGDWLEKIADKDKQQVEKKTYCSDEKRGKK